MLYLRCSRLAFRGWNTEECISTSLSQGRHGVMKIESTAVMSNPKADPHTILIHGQPLTEVNPASGNIHTQQPATMKSTSSSSSSSKAQQINVLMGSS